MAHGSGAEYAILDEPHSVLTVGHYQRFASQLVSRMALLPNAVSGCLGSLDMAIYEHLFGGWRRCRGYQCRD